MDFNATIDLIIKDLNEAREIIDDLKKYPGVPVLQVELAKSKCKSAAEVIALLKNMKDNTPEVSEGSVQQKQKQKQQVPEEKKSSPSSVRVTSTFEEKKTETITVENQAPPVEKHEDPGKTHDRSAESAIIADKFSHLTNRFNEQLESLKNDDDMLKSKPIISLSEAIGVNDKFLFIREIFDGKKDDYLQAISRLESAKSIVDARAVIMSYTGDNTENEAVIQLLDLVKRKLPSNE